ncbi:sensor histidine kinase [Bacillus infantis]|uniref:histidine kinase n=1 Tax=Bacillus infantis TaxID=324767 RepID=A0A5D4QYZ6_9BACI|nr:HAMP domain-containing sensor histidine kinase [Bacillus infantis]TYS43126.1 HAMP domain-containing histidine kinase [Bacillus infantis]
MKIKYFYQLLISHISILIMAFLLLSLLFTQFVQNYVFQNKTEELNAYGEQVLKELSVRPVGNERFLEEYSRLLRARNINYYLFDANYGVIYPQTRGLSLLFTEEERQRLAGGHSISIKHDIKRFEQEVTLVAIPYMHDSRMTGGILLMSPISGALQMASQLNKFLLYTIIISLTATILLSWVLSKNLLKRIKELRNATSMISKGDYNVNIKNTQFDEIGELAEDFNHMAAKLRSSNEEIERLENRRRTFIADVSHEMRTPLTTISGMAEGLKNNLIPEQEKQKGMDLIDREARRLIRLVNENLDYEKIRSNQIKLDIGNIQVLDLFEVVKEQLDIQAEEKGIEIVLDADEELYVKADYDRIIQIIINIVKNSIQFTDGGTVWLRGRKGDEETVIEIEDTGIGIDPGEIESIWHRFYKADLSRTSSTFGEFGIGLSIVKQLVQLHNGEIEVESERNRGTLFRIRFPK